MAYVTEKKLYAPIIEIAEKGKCCSFNWFGSWKFEGKISHFASTCI